MTEATDPRRRAPTVAESLETRLRQLALGRRAPQEKSDSRHWDLTDMAVAVRWGALSIAAISVFGPIGGGVGTNLRRDATGASILVVYCIVRTLRPIPSNASRLVLLPACAAETALCTLVAFGTGGWSSPLLLMVGSALVISGLLGGFRALLVSVATVLVFELLGVLIGNVSWLGGVRSSIAAQRIPELAVMGAVGSYVHEVFYRQTSRYSQIKWMNEVQGLLFELYTVAAEHPGLFTVQGAVDATVARLRDALSSDVVVLMLRPSTAEGYEEPWEVVHCEGIELPRLIHDGDLPAALLECAESLEPEVRESLTSRDRIAPGTTSGMYAPILVRGILAGLLVLERRTTPNFAASDAVAVKEMARYAGIAFDNARSYLRLRNVGAEEERERIARELHDRVGQSLAAVAFNIDRITASLPGAASAQLRPELDAVSAEVRSVNAEIREKLAELRGGPTENLDLVRLLEDFLFRVEMRSKLRISFDHDMDGRLPDVVEREIWRIACEAVRNAERHSSAHNLNVSLRNEEGATVLEVRDDGTGVPQEELLRPDAFGLVGMRERADLIEATLALESVPSKGTTVRLRVPHR